MLVAHNNQLGNKVSSADLPTNVFASAADAMAAAGLAVVPVHRDAKCHPHVCNFDKWKRPPGRRLVAEWAAEWPDANVAILPGLSGVTVADGDDIAQDDEVEDLCGATPLTTRTRRGRHRYYRRTDAKLPANLRPYGLAVDIRQGAALVIAPPSIHCESGEPYTLEGCDWSVLRDLPPLNVEGLHQLIRQHAKPMRVEPQWLNDRLCAQVADCNDFDALLDVARYINTGLADEGCIALDDAVVIRIARNVWRDCEAGKIKDRRDERWDDTLDRANAIIKARCVRTADDTVAMLTVLRNMHAPRCRRGEEFSITPKSMARDRVIPSWNWQRYMRARDRLLKLELIRKVRDHVPTGRIPALYVLVEI